jgi:phosphatidylinositol alpha-1,6-mannosyltransferase
MVALLLHYTTGFPYILLNYGEELSVQARVEARRGGRFRTWVFRRTFRHTRGATVISDHTADLVKNYGVPAERIHKVVPSYTRGIPAVSPESLQQVSARYGLDNRRVLLCAGRLIQRKGQDRLLQALPQIRRQFPDVHLIIAGDGPMKDALQAIIEAEGVADYVTLTGAVDDETLMILFNLCDVFVMPNRTLPNGDVEGFGITFIEAGAAGKPVVGGRSGGTADAVIDGETGLLVNGDDPAEIADAVNRLLADPALSRQMGAAGRNRSLEVLSPKNTAQRFYRAICDLI